MQIFLTYLFSWAILNSVGQYVIKGTVQRILTGVNTTYAQIIRAGKLEARPFFFSNFKGTPAQEEHKTIFSS
jgi:hypothetical protein